MPAISLVVLLAVSGGPALASERSQGLPGDADRAVYPADDRPAWLTDDLLDEVIATGTAAPPPDAPLPGTVGIRPGTWMVSPKSCTLAFLFRDGSDLAIGTAGHCVVPGQPVVALTLLPGEDDAVLVRVGGVLVQRVGEIGNDFALVQVRDQLASWASPTTAVIGGPCGAHTGNAPDVVEHYGHGDGVGAGGTARAGVATQWRSSSFGFIGAALWGDSGSPVLDSRFRAAGIITHLVADDTWLPAVVVGTSISKMRKIAGDYRLVSSSLCGVVPGTGSSSEADTTAGSEA